MEEGDGETIDSLSVRVFLASRVQEINSISQEIAQSAVPESKGLAFQHLPKHLRRRAVSHNVKRLPKRLQTDHIRQVLKSKGSLKPENKRSTRKYRRKKSNLLAEYNRRQRDQKWLETHIWHAKRFKMEKKWGYKIPLQPTDKGYRALYRGASRYCTVRDISFYSCLQLTGPFNEISTKISSAFAPSAANPLSVSAQFYKDGKREGSLYFYKSRSYPFGFIGRVRFQWKPDQTALYLWVHPAQKDEILQELCLEFNLDPPLKIHEKNSQLTNDHEVPENMEVDEEENKMDVDVDKTETIKSKLNIDEIKALPKSSKITPTWSNEVTIKSDNDLVTLIDLEGAFNRIRLYGPAATDVLKETLKILSPEKLDSALNFDKNDKKSRWWTKYFGFKESEESSSSYNLLENQCELWDKLRKIEQVPRNAIIPLIVNDPRVFVPVKRTKAKNNISEVKENLKGESDDEEDFENVFDKVKAQSPIWEKERRNEILKEKMSDEEFCRKRAQVLIPGTMVDLGADENQVPVILVHRPSSSSTGFQNGGWDMIIPSGWAMPFWVAFSYRAVRACGLRDAVHYEFESGSMHTEDGLLLSPDTTSGIVDAEEVANKMKFDYFRYPPAKRVNLIKFSCPFPFGISWSKLFPPELEDENNLFVCRDRMQLRLLQRLAVGQQLNADEMEVIEKLIKSKGSCLVGVKLVIHGKGIIEPGAAISLGKDTDFNANKGHLQTEEQQIREPLRSDEDAQEKRRTLTQKHHKMLSFLIRKRKKLRKKIKYDPSSLEGETLEENLALYDSTVLSANYNETMNKLWLPDCDQVLSTLTRQPIGFILFGQESYSEGKSAGFGYCSIQGIYQWIQTESVQNKRRFVLIRNCKSSLLYRFAKMEICQIDFYT